VALVQRLRAAVHAPRPGFTRQRAVDSRHQLISLFKLAVRGLRHAHFCSSEQLFSGFLLFGLEGSSHSSALSASDPADGTALSPLSACSAWYTEWLASADVQRLLVIGKLAFQLIHFQFGGFGAGFVLFLAVNGFATTSFCSSRRICSSSRSAS
jgi:hypothetical protein